ncbi:hypothetical protein B0A50_03176 [Salinomyces thailandicus]|uniref:Peroxin 26 n=1 Tax=Salinomyces thailandicus TaxID=706561 RepID=A0A4U0U5F4_9PEZI|nr:hypothetical protein B0A50_03176 [Salinomyces thailandica]
MASTETMTMQDSLHSDYLSSSFSNLSRSRSTNSLIVRTYKQATQLYLTKRFKEALETLEPIISPQRQESEDGEEGPDEHQEESPGISSAPVAQSSKGTRTKVWVFYLSLLHAIVDLGAEEGKLVFGSARWRQLANKAHEGTVWDEVVNAGYGGEEGEVDPDVVVNLSTLLIGHMSSQRLNQTKLEAWLAGNESPGGQFEDGTATPMSTTSASSPKALATRLKILELYTLHVLPANDEWQYAREFIQMSDMLDEERKDAFWQALQQLKEERDGTALRERELAERREREMEEQKWREEEERKIEDARRAAEERRRSEEAEKQKAEKAKAAPATNGAPKATSSSSTSRPAGRPPPNGSGRPKKPPAPPATLYGRASSALHNLQSLILNASRGMTANNVSVFRLLMFMLAFIVLIARRDLRERIRRAVEEGWVKVKKTVGMGVKVSYI